MLLSLNSKKIVKCKVARFTKTPYVRRKDQKPPYCEADTNKPLPLYTIRYSKHRTMFYTKNNSIYFYQGILIRKEKIVPFYDQKTENYCITNLKFMIEGRVNIINHFKASNGYTYFVYLTEDSATNRFIVVYNHTKNKIVFSDNPKTLDHITFKIAIANSLLVSILSEGFKIQIKVIDITKEKIETLHISLDKYLIKIMDLLSDISPEDSLKKLNEIVYNIINSQMYANRESVEYNWAPDIATTVSVDSNNTAFYKDLQIQVNKISIKTLKIIIHKAFYLSFTFKSNKMVIQVNTGKEGYININRDTINIPPDKSWIIGEYVLNNEYNISKSQLYSVTKVSKDYIIIDDAIYYPDPKIPKNYTGYTTKNRIEHIFDNADFSIFKSESNLIVFSNFTSSKINYKTTIYTNRRRCSCGYSNKTIEIISINQVNNFMVQMQKKYNSNSSEITELPKDLIKTVNINEIALTILTKIYGTTPTNEFDYCWCYIDEEKGYLYYIIIHKEIFGDRKIILFKYHIEDSKKLPEIIAYFELESDDLLENPELLKTQIVNFIAFRRGNQLYIAQLLEVYGNKHTYSFLNDMTIEAKYPIFQFNDIKYNRTKKFLYYTNKFEEIYGTNKLEDLMKSLNIIDTDIKRRYSTVIFSVKLRTPLNNLNIIVPFVIADLMLTRRLSADCP